MPVQVRTTRSRVLVISLAHGTGNVLAAPLRVALLNALRGAESDTRVKAVVIAGNGRTFSAGADLAELDDGLQTPASLQREVIPFLHGMRKPVVAAVAGHALGGGLELALWCHARVAASDARVGLPETTLGLMPGAGGTQLLPRAVGLERAVSMILSGAVLSAHDLRDTALFDTIVEGGAVLRTAEELALALALVQAGPEVDLPHLSRRKVQDAHAQGFLAFARAQARARRNFLPGMMKALDAVALSLRLPALQGLAAEYDMFRSLVDSDEARALRHAFLAERAAPRVDDVASTVAPRTIARAAVVGARYMGSGIAQCLAKAGIAVQMFDVDASAARRAVEHLRTVDGLSPESVHVAERMHDLGEADLVIEAIVESLPAKLSLLRELDAVVKAGALLATNTSTLDIDAMAAVTGRPHDVIGLHFFGPAPAMRLLEVVRAAKTTPQSLATALDLAKRLRKVAVVSRVGPGFICNRIFDRLLHQALALAALGLRPWDIDKALEHWGWRMGPFRTMDLIGNDVLLKARDAASTAAPGAQLQQRLVAAGRVGQKTGRGWYRYEAGNRKALPDPDIEPLLPVAGDVSPDAQAIVERCVLALINESAKVLQAGVAQRASDIDIAFLLGYGFPKTRGGPLFHADEMGAAVLVRKLEALLLATGDEEFAPAQLLLTLAATGGRFLPRGRDAAPSAAETNASPRSPS